MPELNAETEQQESGAPAEEANAAVSTSMPPDYVRNSPEYRELQSKLRDEARRRGSMERELATARAAAESARQAAEAQAEAARQAEIEAILGPEGVAFWNDFADLSAANPTEAARRLAAFRQQVAQSPEPATTIRPAAPAENQQEAAAMSEHTAPPVAPRAVGEAPLGQRPDETAQLIATLEGEFNSVVQRNLDPATRNRVTMKDRANGLISYLLAAYTKAGARPKNG